MAGNELLKRGQWKDARLTFEQALLTKKSPEAYEGLGTACSWLNDATATINARETAFRLFKDRGDSRSAARIAAWLATDYAEFRGEPAVANGWLQQARRLLDGVEPCEEQAFVLGVSAAVKLFGEHDFGGAMKLAEDVRLVAETVQSAEGILIAGSLQGLILVSEGRVQEGMHLLDEVTATAFLGECEDLYLIGSACCCLITACERVRDFDRAAQWCRHVKEFCHRWRIGSLLGVCRTQYSSVLISRAEWAEAEEELILATEELSERRPALVSAATVRLAELRRRQGRTDEARRLFESVKTHPLAILGLSALALDENEPSAATEFAERFLRRIPATARIEQVPGFEILIRAYALQRMTEKAGQFLKDLKSIINLVKTEPLQGAGRYAEGVICAAEDRPSEALACFEDAIDLYDKACLPYESVEARVELAIVLNRLQRDSRAREEAQVARELADKIGANVLLRRALDLLPPRSIGPGLTPHEQDKKALSSREREVLLLVAQGKDNNEIAEELFLSVRTIERHTSNIYQKLGITGKAARTAAAAYALKNLTQTDSPRP